MVKIILPFILLVGVLSEASAQSCDESKTPYECAELRGCYWTSRGQCKKLLGCGSLLTKGDCQLYGAHMCFWSWQKICVPSYSDYDYYGIDNEDDEEDKGAEVDNITPIKEVGLLAEYEYENDEDENLPTNKNNDVDVSADITSGSQPSHVYLRAGERDGESVF